MTTLLLLSRAIHFGSGMMLVGVVAFRRLVLLPGLAGIGEEEWNRWWPFLHRLNAVFIGAFGAMIVSGLSLFWTVAAGMSGSSLSEALDLETWDIVLNQTQFGAVFLGRTVLAAILILVVWLARCGPWRTRRSESVLEIFQALLVVALLVSLSWTGHAAAAGSAWRTGSDAVHLFGSAVWPTGLLFFAMFLGEARRLGQVANLEAISAVVRRFSGMSLIAVIVLAGTGTVNACTLVGSFSAMVTTGYGRLLDLKLALFLVMLLIAAWNRFRLLPLLFRTDDPLAGTLLLRQLRRFVLTEFVLAVAIVAVVAVLGATPPPR